MRNRKQVMYNRIRPATDIGVVPFTIRYGLAERIQAPTHGPELARERMERNLMNIRRRIRER